MSAEWIDELDAYGLFVVYLYLMSMGESERRECYEKNTKTPLCIFSLFFFECVCE
jgi:hypothetical protein